MRTIHPPPPLTVLLESGEERIKKRARANTDALLTPAEHALTFQSSVPRLQRLISSASSSLSPHTQCGQRQLESVTEEAHMYDLLYPNVDSLLQPQHHT